jgi:glycosyltransferase involved in cell wall biosynthesis
VLKVLYITNKPAYPITDGGCYALAQFLNNLLSASYSVKYLTLSTQKHPFSLDAFPVSILENTQPEHVAINTKTTLFQAVKHLFSNRSYNISRFKSKAFSTCILNQLKNNDVQVVVLESIYLADYLSLIRAHSKAKVIIRTHNVEHKIWERLAFNSKNIFRSLYYRKLAYDLKKEEINALNESDGIACISNDDEKIIKEWVPSREIETIPVSITPTETEMDYQVTHFFHLGSMNWKPNKEAVNWLIQSIFPKIKEQIPEAKLHLAGSNLHLDTDKLISQGIICDGFVKDAEHYMAENGIMLVPLKSGSGVRIKILEGLSLGVPIVTTKLGIEGIHVGSESGIIKVAKNETEFIQEAITLYGSQKARTDMGRKAKQFIKNNYQYEVVTKKISEFFQKISA